MEKFIEAKETKGYSYNDIAKAVGDGYPDAPAVSNIFHGNKSASIELLTKIGVVLGLSDNDIQEAYLENRIVFIEKELASKKSELEQLRNKNTIIKEKNQKRQKA